VGLTDYILPQSLSNGVHLVAYVRYLKRSPNTSTLSVRFGFAWVGLRFGSFSGDLALGLLHIVARAEACHSAMGVPFSHVSTGHPRSGFHFSIDVNQFQ